MKINFDITIKSKKWLEFDHNYQLIVNQITNISQNLIKYCPITNFNPKKNNIEIAISLLSNHQIRAINLKYRQIDKATNVLSFPSYNQEELKQINLFKKNNQFIFLGDILISFEKVKQEAIKQKKDLKKHLTHLILHSILHLLGFDHDNDINSDIMEKLEIKILQKLNISNPYQLLPN